MEVGLERDTLVGHSVRTGEGVCVFVCVCLILSYIAVKEIAEAGTFIKKRGLFGSRYCRLYEKHGAWICFWGGIRELSIKAEGEGRAGVSCGDRGSKRKRRGCQALINNQLSRELVGQELTHQHGEGTRPLTRDPPPRPKHLPPGQATPPTSGSNFNVRLGGDRQPNHTVT